MITTPSCRIAHITDLHIAAQGALVFDLVDTVKATRQIVGVINALDPQPDVVLVTGDLTHEGGEDASRRAIAELRKLRVPFRVANGNHDCRVSLARALGASSTRVARNGLIDVSVYSGVRFIGLDTVVADPRKSEFPQSQMAFLEQELNARQLPTVIYMHHPPFDTGINWLDEMKPEKGRHELGALMARHPSILCMCCGHLHRPFAGRWYGIPVFAAPSVMNPVDIISGGKGDEITLGIKSPSGFHLLDYSRLHNLHTSLRYLDGYCQDWQPACKDPGTSQMIAE